jgi:hypothetical protein
VLTQSLIWKQLDRNHGRDANQCRRGREKDWGRLADLGVRPHQGAAAPLGPPVGLSLSGISFPL